MIFRIIAIAAVMAGTFLIAKSAKANVEQAPLTSLEGSEWGPENGLGQFILFQTEGQVSGYAGCNSFFGTYEQNGEKLTFGPLAMTRKMCIDGMGAELAFMAAIESTRSLKATHIDLELFDENNEKVLSMRRRDWD